jgi:hypothetical protein
MVERDALDVSGGFRNEEVIIVLSEASAKQSV